MHGYLGRYACYWGRDLRTWFWCGQNLNMNVTVTLTSTVLLSQENQIPPRHFQPIRPRTGMAWYQGRKIVYIGRDTFNREREREMAPSKADVYLLTNWRCRQPSQACASQSPWLRRDTKAAHPCVQATRDNMVSEMEVVQAKTRHAVERTTLYCTTLIATTSDPTTSLHFL